MVVEDKGVESWPRARKGRSGQAGLRDASGVVQQTCNFPDSGHGQRRKERSRWPIRSHLSGWLRVAQGLWGLRDDVCGGLARAQSPSPRQAPPDPFRPSRCHFQHEASLGNPLMHAACPSVQQSLPKPVTQKDRNLQTPQLQSGMKGPVTSHQLDVSTHLTDNSSASA